MSPTGRGQLHSWHIAPTEYERHEQRRGRRHAYTAFDPTRTALVVIDMIPFFVDENPYAAGIVSNINLLAASLRDRGGTVAWVVPFGGAPTVAQTEFFGAEVAERYARSGGQGSLSERLHASLAKDSDDVFVAKTSPSAFFPGRCLLNPELEAREIENLVVVGTVANVCCESTVRDASALGYRVVMVADANAATNDAALNATLTTMYRSFSDVRATAEVIELIRGD